MPFTLDSYEPMVKAIEEKKALESSGWTWDNGLLAAFPQTIYTPFVVSAAGSGGDESEIKALTLMLSLELGCISVINLALDDSTSYIEQLFDIADDADLDSIVNIRQLASSCDCEVLMKGLANHEELENKIISTIERHGFSGTAESVESHDEAPSININIRIGLLALSSAESCPNRVYDLLKEIIFAFL